MPSNYQIPATLANGRSLTLAPNTPVFSAGDPCRNFYFVKQGIIRVDLVNRQGKSVLLYRINDNETCVLTTSCLLSDEDYAAEAKTETEVNVIAIEKSDFQSRLNSSKDFRDLVFRSFSSRLSVLMAKLDEVAFSPLDARLAARLLELGKETQNIEITHDRLAQDLGSAREVISRKLVGWEREGIIERRRGAVTLISRTDLQKLSRLGD
ncbi:MAG: Crp/Fnr family transcriptional regulator [Stappiaceae bacterium]